MHCTLSALYSKLHLSVQQVDYTVVRSVCCVSTELEQQIKKHYNQTGEIPHSSRLHILLPLSAAAPAKIEEEDRNVLFHQNLPEMQLDRAGVRKRVYKHSIYKITDHEQAVRSKS